MIPQWMSHRTMCLLVVCINTLLAGCIRPSSDGGKSIRVIDLESFHNLSRSYSYVGEYSFISIRPSRGDDNHFLRVTIDSASFNESANMICVAGRVMNTTREIPLENVQVLAGKVQEHSARIIGNDRRPPVPAVIYRMTPDFNDSTDSEGRFAICTKIDRESSLMIAKKNFFIEVYEVGKLVDSSASAR